MNISFNSKNSCSWASNSQKEVKTDEKLNALLEKSKFFYQIGADSKKTLAWVSQNFTKEEFPDFKDDLTSTKLKMRKLLTNCQFYFKQITGNNLKLRQIKKIENFLNDFKDEFSALTQVKIYKVCFKFYNKFRSEIVYFFEDKRFHLTNPLIQEHLKLYCDKKPEFGVDESWLHLPDFNPDQGLLEKLKADWKLLCQKMKENSSLTEVTTLLNQNLAHEYKIHLMPKGIYAYATLEKLLTFMDEDGSLKSSIDAIKILRTPCIYIDASQGNAPVIVIYTTEKKNAQNILNSLLVSFKPFFNWGSGCRPRYNYYGKNPLIFYAQGDSYQKVRLKKSDPTLFSQIYDKEGIHYNSQFGNFALSFPQPATGADP